MKILLLNPPARRQVQEAIVLPPLGLAYVAAALLQKGYQVTIKDAFAERMNWVGLADFLKTNRPDILGLSSMSPTVDLAFKAAKLARPLVKFIVMGGPHISAWGREVFRQCPELDFGVIGEGEETMVELVSALAANRYPQGIPGVIGPDFDPTPRALHADLDTLPMPARHLLPLSLYRYPFANSKRVTTLFTSRGCPYHCIFCDKSVFGSRWRARSVDHILAELDEIVNYYQILSLVIYDDLFTLSRQRVHTLCQGIIERGYPIDWKCEGRVDQVDPETLKLMRRAGCSMIAYGVESGNQSGLNFLNKKITLAQARRAFALTHQAGLQTMAYFIFGIPVETYADEVYTIEFAKEIDPTYVQFSTLSPYCGTPLYQEAQTRGWYAEVDAHNPLDKDLKRPAALSSQWTPALLQRILRRAHLSFFLRPRYLMKRLLAVKSFRQFINLSRAGLVLSRWLR